MSLRNLLFFIYALAFIPLLTALDVENVYTIDRNTGTPILQFDPKGTLLAAVGDDQHGIDIFKVGATSPWRTIQKGSECSDIQWSPDGRFLCTFDVHHRNRIWKVESRETVKEFVYDPTQDHSVAWAPDGQTFAHYHSDPNQDRTFLKIEYAGTSPRESSVLSETPFAYPEAWSATGELAFKERRDLHLVDLSHDSHRVHRDLPIQSSLTFHPRLHKLTLICPALMEHHNRYLLVPPSDFPSNLEWNRAGTLLAQHGRGGIYVRKFNGNSFHDLFPIAEGAVSTVAWGRKNTLAFDQGNRIRVVCIVAAALHARRT